MSGYGLPPPRPKTNESYKGYTREVASVQPSQFPTPTGATTILVVNLDSLYTIDLCSDSLFNPGEFLTVAAGNSANWPPNNNPLWCRVSPGQNGNPTGVSVWVQPNGSAAPPATISINPNTQHGSQQFVATGATQQFVVPAGVTALTVDMTGAQGGTGGTAPGPFPGGIGGLGGRVQTTLTVTPGTTLTLNVAKQGSNGATGNIAGGAGGFGGGGTGGGSSSTIASSGGGGGGASSITNGINVLTIAAGGGGGSGTFQTAALPGVSGGGGGGGTGQNGTDGQGVVNSGGKGGTQTTGGAVGAGGGGSPIGTAGTALQGGNGGTNNVGGTGAGGGGLFGGGGGGTESTTSQPNGGGGGGSSGLPQVGGVGVGTTTAAFRSGDGYINLSW